MHFEFTAPLWRYHGETAAWFFVTLPDDVADDIDDRFAGDDRPGFGSVPVRVQVGATRWRTSVFPSNEHRSFVLPVKKAVRMAEGLEEGEPVAVVLEV